MIERIAEMAAGMVGFRVAGEVEREDYRDVLVPELRRTLDAGGGLRTLYLIEDLDEVEPGARVFETAALEAAKQVGGR